MKRLLLVALILLVTAPVWAANVCTGDLLDLIDVGKLAYLRDSECTQISSYDRTGGNDDGFSGKYSFIRMEGDKRVIFDADGPGCIYRFWTAMPDDKKLEFYFDGSDKPGLVFDQYQDMFLNKQFPFLEPLSKNFLHGWCSYVPIPFAKHCKIVASGETKFLQITWQKFSNAEGVKTFSTDFTPEYKAKFEQVKKVWTNPGSAPWGETTPAKWKTIDISAVANADAKIDLVKMTGNGVVHALYLNIESADPRVYRKAVLSVTTDGKNEPNVWTPVGDFFLDGFGWPAGKSTLTGKSDSGYYSYWPIPYSKGISISMANDSADEVKITGKAIVEPMKSLPRDMGRFYAWWHRENATQMGKGFEILTAKGRGHWCGVNHYMQGIQDGVSFLEGDEMLWIDGGDNSRYNGTGTEDYFNGGWYFGEMGSAPDYGCLILDAGTVDAYRFHVGDTVPFQKNARIEIEHGGKNNHPADYQGVTFWYGEPGLTHTFKPVAVEDRLLPPRKNQGTEAEQRFRGGGPWVMINGGEKGIEYSGLAAVVCKADNPGGFVTCKMGFEATASYEVSAQVKCGPDCGIVQAYIGDTPIGEPVDCYLEAATVRVKTFAKTTPDIQASGDQMMTFKVIGRNEKSTACNMAIDEVFIKRNDLYEGERMKMLPGSGKAEVQQTALIGTNFNGDEQLLLTGGMGSTYEFEMPVKESNRYYIAAYMMKGPDCGKLRLTVDGKEVAGEVNLYEAERGRTDMMRYGGEYDLSAGKHVLRIEITGKDAKSTGYLVGLDAIGLERVHQGIQ